MILTPRKNYTRTNNFYVLVHAEENTGTHRMLQIQYPQLEVVHSRDVSSGRMNDEIMVHVYDSNQLA